MLMSVKTQILSPPPSNIPVSFTHKLSNLVICSPFLYNFHVAFTLLVIIFETADQFKACAVSLRHAHNHQKTSQKQIWAFTHSTKIASCCFSPLPCWFFWKKDDILTWTRNQKIRRQGKAGSHWLQKTIHPCLSWNENCPCWYSSLPTRFFLLWKWGLNVYN